MVLLPTRVYDLQTKFSAPEEKDDFGQNVFFYPILVKIPLFSTVPAGDKNCKYHKIKCLWFPKSTENDPFLRVFKVI